MDKNSTISLRSGNDMPVLGIGTWKLTDNTAAAIVEALNQGYAMIDTSGDYGTQPGIGEGLRRADRSRDDLYLVTKIEETDDPLVASANNLNELGVDYVDLMLLHRPPEQGAGRHLWEGLTKVRDDGLARDIGVSNYSMELIDELIDATGEVPAVNQVEWSPFGHSPEFLEHAGRHGIVVQAYSPLTRATRLDDARLNEIGRRHDKTPAQVLVRWNIQHGTVPLPKANKAPHIQQNIDVFDFRLSDDEMAELDALNERYSALGSLPYA